MGRILNIKLEQKAQLVIDLAKLELKHRTNRDYPIGCKQIAEKFGVHTQTCVQWLRQYYKNKSITDLMLVIEGHKNIFNDEQD